MKNIFLALFTTLLFSTQVFAVWSINCAAPGATMHFSESSFIGQPQLRFTSEVAKFNLFGSDIVIEPAFATPGTHVWAISKIDDLRSYSVSFTVPELGQADGTKAGQKFIMDAHFASNEGRSRDETFYLMSCEAQDVLY